MLTTQSAVQAKAKSIRTIRGSEGSQYKDDLFNSEVVKTLSTSIFFMVTTIDNKRSAASWRAKYQQMIKCN